MKIDFTNNNSVKDFFLKLITLETAEEIKLVLKEYDLWDDKKYWRYYGDNNNNNTTIGNQSSNPIKSIVEKITNSYDSRLMLECRKMGIDPKDNQKAPGSIKEAIERFFYNNKNSKFKDFISLQDETAVFATGKTDKPTISVIDKGEGQTPTGLPNTILSLGRDNKMGVRFVQGTHNAGGSGYLNFCKDGISFIVTRREQSLVQKSKDTTDDEWCFTVTRKESAKENNMKEPYYTFLAPSEKNMTNDKMGVLSFKSESLKLWPVRVNQYQKDIDHGTMIKMIEYELKSPSSIVVDFMYHTEIMMPDAMMPCRLHECRDYYKRNIGEKNYREQTTTLQGFIYRNTKENIKALEEGFPIIKHMNFSGYKLKVYIFAFKYDLEEEKPLADRRRMNNEGVVFVLGGQHYSDLPTSFFTRKAVNLPRIKDDLIIVVDCTGIDGDLKNEIFKTDKSTMFNRKRSEELTNALIDCIKINELEALQNKRKDQLIDKKLGDEKPLEETLAKIIKKNPSLAALFKIGPRLSNPFNTKETGEENTKKKQLNFYPTYFNWKKKIEKDQTYIRDGNINKQLRFDIITDAEDDYFIREKDVGNLEVKLSVKDENDLYIKISPDEINYNQYLKNGDFLLSLKIPHDIKVGNKIRAEFLFSDSSTKKPFILLSEINIVEASEKTAHEKDKNKKNKSKDKGNKKNPTGFTLPEARWIERKDWQKYKFNDYSALHAEFNGISKLGGKEVEDWEFYINKDNIHLLNELKASNKLDPKIIQERYRLALVFMALSIIEFKQKLEKEQKIEIDRTKVSEEIRELTSSISSVILPIVEHLGGITEDIYDVES